jgi:hypothetical protein
MFKKPRQRKPILPIKKMAIKVNSIPMKRGSLIKDKFWDRLILYAANFGK